MNMRRQAANSLGAAIAAVVSLPSPPTIISAPPSAVADSPAVAIWLEKFKTVWIQDDEISVGPDGNLLVGARAVIRSGDQPAMLDDLAHLSRVGTMIGSGRIWVGSRLAPKREETEDAILLAFNGDELAVSRLLVRIPRPRVGPYELAWDWHGAAFVGDSEWTQEYAFAERLWDWIQFDLEIDVLVPRNSSIVRQFVVSSNFARAIDSDPAIVATDPGTDHMTLNADGSITEQMGS